MSQFFFHFSCERVVIRDNEGCVFSDLRAAHRHALLLIHKLVLLDEADWEGWSVRITDANDRSKLSVLFPCAPIFNSEGSQSQIRPNKV